MIKKLKPVTAHKPVLMQEVLDNLDIKPRGLYLDVTFGSGGHTRAILVKEPKCHVIAMDWDALALETFGHPLQEEFKDRLTLLWGNFSNLYKLLKKYDIHEVDGILADFGTSQIQIAQTPGISFFRDTPLDMRLSSAHQQVTAADVLNRSSQEKLSQLFFELWEEPKSRQIARAIVAARSKKYFSTTGQLVDVIESVIPNKGKRGIHPATKVFQALRIYVNHELENIQAFLPAAVTALKTGGRLACISFHSLEDRMVKQFFKDQELAHTLEIVTARAVVAADEEIMDNPSARSAKLRVAQKIK
jgi:16S rRNA (cytosine1402-N4)-methyltransferase